MSKRNARRKLEQRVKRLAAQAAGLKQTEARLRESNMHYQLLLENLSEVIYTLDQEARITYISPNIEKVGGYPPEQILGRSYIDFVHPEDVPDRTIQFQRVLSGESIASEYRLLSKNRGAVWIMTNAKPIFREGAVVGAQGILMDITGRKEVEQRYRFLVEESNDIIWTFDIATMRYTYCSKSVERILGYPQHKTTGATMEDVFSPEAKKKVMAAFVRTTSGSGKSDRVLLEAEHRHRNGGSVWMEVNAVLHRDSFDNPVSFTGVSRDITGRKRAEETLLRQQGEREHLEKQLRHAQRMEAVGTLAGGIAHDFNNILSSVIGYTELSLDEIQTGTPLHQNLSEVLKAGNRAKDLVKQILTLSRQNVQEFLPVFLIPLIRDSLKMLRSATPTSIEFRENLCSEQLIVLADPTQLHQVIINLATNAVHAMANGEGILEISVEPACWNPEAAGETPERAPGNYAWIRVSDTGGGIPGQHLDRIFEPYFTTKKIGEGTGLGLSIVHGIVKSHKGHIAVDSEIGKGTTFHIHLPLAAADSPAEKLQITTAEPLPTGTESILLVDDELSIAKLLQQFLQRLGYRVTAAVDSMEALETLRKAPHTFDLVITDMTMPNLTGDKLAGLIKQIRPDLPVVLCTGFSEKVNGRIAPEIDKILLKPIQMSVLANTIRNLITEGGNDCGLRMQ